MSTIGNGVSLKGLYVEDFNFPFLLSGTIVKADEGKALSQDTTAANTAKLCTDGDVILGRLEVFEDRTVEGIKIGTVNLKGGHQFSYVLTGAGSDEPPVLGGSVVGSATPGKVKKAAASAYNVVVEVDTVAQTCVVLLK